MVKTKQTFMSQLPKVKVVLGNGFDLHCGLMSSYGNYFEYFKDKYKHIREWIDEFGLKFIDSGFKSLVLADYWLDFKGFEYFNVWDVFFEIANNGSIVRNEARWCDIEDEMLKSFAIRNIVSDGAISWFDVFDLVSGNKHPVRKPRDTLALSAFVLKKLDGIDLDKNIYVFFEFLLSQLDLFEKNFGKYLSRQHNYFDRFINHHNSRYDEKALETISLFGEVGENGNIVSIDSFNFGKFNNPKLDSVLRNINGVESAPIFGIDSNDGAWMAFSKTSRRMQMEMQEKEIPEIPSFENAIIYGHSLSKNDYSYFFPLLDKLKMTDFSATNIVVFAFSIYDNKHEHLIRLKNRLAIQELFYSYAIFKGQNKEPFRLLDALTTQGRIITYEIPCYDEQNDYFWH